MKNIISAFVLMLFLLPLTISSCSDWTEVEGIKFQDHTANSQKTPEYYANLRAYKKTDHAIMFGWFGGWFGGENNAHMGNALRGAPDSVDILTIWSKTWTNLTDAQKEDLRYVQEVLGTRVTFTVFSHDMTNLFIGNIPEGIKNDAASIPMAAKALSDTIFKYGYDGIDFDHEVGSTNLFSNKANMTTLLREMRANLGPDKLIMVDGKVSLLTPEAATYVDYAIGQNYGSSNGQSYYNNIKHMFKPEQLIVTESFEASYATGGYVLSQARWNPTEGRKGGSGVYHIEYEYARNPSYKYVREAIQIMNPAKQ